MASVEKLVDEAIAGSAVVVFSKTYCPFCKKAKAAIEEATKEMTDFKPVIYELDEREDGAAIQAYLLSKTEVRTVPQVFIGGTFIGGGDDTAGMQREGKLGPAIAEALKK